MLPITLGASSFKYGPVEIAYSDVFGAGIGLQERRVATYRSLIIGYRQAGDPKPHKILFRLPPGPEGNQLVEGLRARIPDRWQGEAPFFAMNKKLGFSNKMAFTATAIAVLVAVVITAVLVGSSMSKNADAPRKAIPAQTPRR
ncbi:Hypothetical protein A7982_06110 [Minicystis rosea]|nr:Hypothetical protein A7982_06110 [Minicystis rosea]